MLAKSYIAPLWFDILYKPFLKELIIRIGVAEVEAEYKMDDLN